MGAFFFLVNLSSSSPVTSTPPGRRSTLLEYFIYRFQPLGYVHRFHINSDLLPYLRIALQGGFYGHFFAFEGSINDQVAVVKPARRSRKIQFLGCEGEPTAVGQLPIYINVIMHPFLQAVGIQVEENTVYLLGLCSLAGKHYQGQ